MTDHELRHLRDLLTDAVADVEPAHALDEIRARTTTTKRHWPYAAGGAMLAVAASVAAFAMLGNDTTPRATDPGTTTSPSASATEPPTAPPTGTPSASPVRPPSAVVAVYYVGDTPDGPRLYREFRSAISDDLLTEAVSAAVGRAPDDRPLAPLDPDYRSAWPSMTAAAARTVPDGDDVIIEINLSGDPEGSLHDRGSLSEAEASLAIEQLIYTAQAAIGERAPVQFLLYGERTDQVLGLPTSEPLANGPVLDTLALVSLTSPSEGMLVDNDEPLVVEGVGNSFEGNIVTRVQRWEGTYVVDQLPTIAGWGEDKLFPFEVTFDLTGVPPGDYVVVSSTDDPSGEGRFHSDSRRITVVD
jgi:hypothetical protein